MKIAIWAVVSIVLFIIGIIIHDIPLTLSRATFGLASGIIIFDIILWIMLKTMRQEKDEANHENL